MKKEQPFEPHTLGQRISHARRLFGVREGRDVLAPDLAPLVGVTAASVYNWEGDASVPGPTNLGKLAEVLGVSVAWLHYGVEGAPVATGYTKLSSASKSAKKRGA